MLFSFLGLSCLGLSVSSAKRETERVKPILQEEKKAAKHGERSSASDRECPWSDISGVLCAPGAGHSRAPVAACASTCARF